jgi:ACS family tartrate transporter-like MFS transporter
MINSLGNLGGFVGPYAIGFLSGRTGSFVVPLLAMAASAIVSGLLVLCLRLRVDAPALTGGAGPNPASKGGDS